MGHMQSCPAHPVFPALPFWWLFPAKWLGLTLGMHPLLSIKTAVKAEISMSRGLCAVLNQAVANNFMHFVILAKYSPLNNAKYAAMLCILIKEFENRFHDC